MSSQQLEESTAQSGSTSNQTDPEFRQLAIDVLEETHRDIVTSAVARILGGVVLFDRRQPIPGSGVDQDAVYIHPDRENVTYRICRLTSEQKLQLLNFLTAEEPDHNPLPILPDEKNDYRIDPEEPPEEIGIYRDIWDRSELREDAYDPRLRDVWNQVDYLTHSDKGNAADRALERKNRIFQAYSDGEP